jgi:hypothetical protein
LGTEEANKHLVRSLAASVVFGCLIFVVFLLFVQFILAYFAGGAGLDSSFGEFYPLMGGLGAIWGFSRWWSSEQGDYNPFHSK